MSSAATFTTHRVLPHSPAAVFAAFANPTVLAEWWGPNGFTNEVERCDFRQGGAWDFVMIGPDGKRYENRSVFGDIVPDARVVVVHQSPPQFILTVSLAALPHGTRVDWVQTFEDESVANAVRHIVQPANEENLDRLTTVLEQRAR